MLKFNILFNEFWLLNIIWDVKFINVKVFSHQWAVQRYHFSVDQLRTKIISIYNHFSITKYVRSMYSGTSYKVPCNYKDKKCFFYKLFVQRYLLNHYFRLSMRLCSLQFKQLFREVHAPHLANCLVSRWWNCLWRKI